MRVAAPTVLLLVATAAGAASWQRETIEYLDGQKIAVYVTEDDIAATPEWRPEQGPPPLTLARLIEIIRASSAADPRLADARIREIKLQPVSHHEKQHRWYYLVKLQSADGHSHYKAVLMNGKLVQAIGEPLPIK